jgi:RNA polymerase sigma-70 factor, ECF subfamily
MHPRSLNGTQNLKNQKILFSQDPMLLPDQVPFAMPTRKTYTACWFVSWTLHPNHALQAMPIPSETSTSLIRRLGQHEARAWEDFAAKYTWMMRRWMRLWKIPCNEVEDIIQETCLCVFVKFHTFERRGNGSFRAWLKQISRNCWLQVVRKAAYQARINKKIINLDELLAEETLSCIDTEIELLIEHELFVEAMERTRRRAGDVAWNAYRMTALEGCLGGDASYALGISIDMVYKKKKHFESKLEFEIKRIKTLL